MLADTRRRRVATTAAVVLATSCGGADAPTAVARPVAGITAVSRSPLPDTALAAPTQTLAVEVRGADGSLATGAAVQFAVAPPADSARRTESPLYVCRVSEPACGPSTAPGAARGRSTTSAADTTDGSGRATVTVRFGTVAGPTQVVITVPALGLRDSVAFTVLPGVAAAVRWPARDLGVALGARRVVTAAVVDAHGNRRAEVPTYAFTGSASVATFDATTRTLTAQDLGTAVLSARFASFVDTAIVRVVPGGRLAVWEAFATAVRLVNTDGTAPRTLAADASSYYGAFPHFTPGGGLVALHLGVAQAPNYPSRIVLLDTAGTARREVLAPAGVVSVAYARPLDDGTVLFIGRGPYAGGPIAAPPEVVYRAAPDGSVTAVATLPNASTAYGGYDISPDGSRVAYMTGGPPYGASTGLRVLTLASGATTLIDGAGQSPRWSRAGDRLAFLVGPASETGGSGTLAIANPDGTGRVNIGTDVYLPGIAWSPDGAYVLARALASDQLRATRLRDGGTVELGLPNVQFPEYRANYFQPDWH